MSTPASPAASAPEPVQQPSLSEPARLINTFSAPSKTFEDIKRAPRWWAPWLVSAVFAMIVGVIAVQKLDMVRLVEQAIEQSPSAQHRMEQLSPQQREQAIGLQATITRISFYSAPIFSLIFGVIIAAILMAVFNFGFGAEVPFPRAMAVTFYAFLPGVITAILLIISLLVSSDPNSINFAARNPVATNPGFFMDSGSNKFLHAIASGLDVINIWTVVLLGLGFSVASPNRKPSPKTGIVTMLVIYGVIVLVRAGFAAM